MTGRLGIAATVLFAATAVAQQAPTAGPRIIVGIVRDTAGRVLDSAEVFIAPSSKRTLTDSVGAFRIRDMRRGTHTVGARRIGFYPQRKEVAVGDSGAVVEFSLVPLIQRLPAVIKAASRGGLSGIIGDTAYSALEGVEIWATTSPANKVFTDARGAFFMDLKPGKHMIRLRKPGYNLRLVSVSIPRDSGREILVNLGPSRGSDRRDLQLTMGMAERIARSSTAWSTIYTREDIVKMGFKDLSSFVNAGAGYPVDEGLCQVHSDGLLRSTPIWMVAAADIEMIEIHVLPSGVGTNNTKQVAGSITRRPRRTPPKCPGVYIWYRK